MLFSDSRAGIGPRNAREMPRLDSGGLTSSASHGLPPRLLVQVNRPANERSMGSLLRAGRAGGHRRWSGTGMGERTVEEGAVGVGSWWWANQKQDILCGCLGGHICVSLVGPELKAKARWGKLVVEDHVLAVWPGHCKGCVRAPRPSCSPTSLCPGPRPSSGSLSSSFCPDREEDDFPVFEAAAHDSRASW